MRDLTVFKKGQIVVARVAVASVTKTAELLGFSRATHIKDHDGIQEALKTLQQPEKFRSDFQSYRQTCIETHRRKKASDHCHTKVTAKLNQHLK